jgi:integrase
MPLSHITIQYTKPKAKPFKLADGDGLFLVIQPNGSKLWRFRYRFNGAERSLSIGPFPKVTIAEARARREQAKEQIANGIDPSVQKRLDRIASGTAARNTFGIIADEYIERLEANGASASTLKKNRWYRDILARPIKSRPIAEITPAEILDLLQRIERSGRRETAHRMRGFIGAVFRLAIVTLRATTDPSYALGGALLRPITKPRAAITDERQFGGLLRAIDAFDGYPTIRAALQFCALTFARPGEVRLAKRSEIDFDKTVWRIPAERTKMRRPHEVPLARQAVEVLRDIWPVSELGDYIFPSVRTYQRPLSDATFNAALRRMGFAKDEVSAHGFRATASTILNERGFPPDVIETALGHQEQNSVRRAYNRAAYWPERVALMQKWADMLDKFRLSPSAR